MVTLFVCDGLTGKLLTFRKPSPKERRLNEASQPAESNLSTSILKRFAGQTVNRENRLLIGCCLAGAEASRMVPTLSSGLESLWNARPNRTGALNSSGLAKKLKRATGGAEE